MNLSLLIDSIVRQTTVLIAQLATRGGVRAPLAQVANQVFLALARELEGQGISRKVSADMFGMSLRTYQRTIQRLNESATDRGHSLWEAVLSFLRAGQVVTRAQVLERFHRDDEVLVRGVLHDLCESGLAFVSGSGAGAVYRATSEAELGQLETLRVGEGIDEFVWAVIYREGPLTKAALIERYRLDELALDNCLQRLSTAGRISTTADASAGEGLVLSATEFLVPFGASLGWEAAIFDHYQAVVKTVCRRLRMGAEGAQLADSVGGSTYTLDIWPGHPFEDEVKGTLKRLRESVGELRQRVETFNAENGLRTEIDRVLVYLGQCVIPSEENDNVGG